MSATPSALPGPARQRLDAMRAAEAAAVGSTTSTTAQTTPADGATVGTVVTPPTQQTAATTVATPTTQTTATETPVTPEGERVTLSRDEYNSLRAASEARTSAEGRAEAARLALDEANHRLTELSTTSKATPQTPATSTAQASTLAIDVSGITFAAEEEEAFAESRTYIEKVARLAVAQELNKLLPGIEQQLQQIKQTAEGAATRVVQTNQRTFLEQVKARVANLNDVITHKHWGDFTDAIEPFSGQPYGALLAMHIQGEKLEQVVNIYDAFKKQYMGAATNADANTGFAGAVPTGGAVQTPAEQAPTQKLKFSDRKKASLDYRHGRITFDEMQQVAKKFEEADKLGNVDYNA